MRLLIIKLNKRSSLQLAWLVKRVRSFFITKTKIGGIKMSKKKVKELLEELEERIEKVQSSEEFKEYLEFFSKFHNYSYRNILLIKMQKPDARLVAGYKQWQKKFNRYVKKGEEGIMILAPYKYKKKVTELKKEVNEGNIVETEVEKEKEFVSFRPVYVFDISQTKGEPVPSWKIEVKDTRKDLLNPFIDYTSERGIIVEFRRLRDCLKGYSEGGKIIINGKLNDTEKVVVLAHEIAHEMLHQSNDDQGLTKEIVELEAEAVSFLVSEYFNIDNPSEKYLALYKKSYNLMKSFKRINEVSQDIINGILELI